MDSLGTSTLVREPEVEVLHEVPARQLRERSRSRASREKRATSKRRALVRHVLNEGAIVFLLAFGAYLIVAVLLAFKYGSMTGDAFSRMANGFYVVYSRDPHLAAV